jgi:peptidoglycan/xylan/chitin deacetylase (PgdA/CDA1 family)
MLPAVSISIEIELAWGFHDATNYADRMARLFSDGRKIETQMLERLLGQCDKLGIPITFNMVGHLLLDECDGIHTGPYEQGWFDADPGTDLSTDPLYYAPDLAEMIDTATVDHEIATHTFSHVLFDSIEYDVADHELTLVEEAHAEAEIPSPTSLIPPRHNSPPVNVLLNQGIDAVRYPAEPIDRRQYPIQSINVCKRIPVGRQFEMDGEMLWSFCDPWPSLTSAMLPTGQRPVSFPMSAIPIALRQRLHEWKLQQAVANTIANRSLLHLHSHLFNMSNEYQMAPLQRFLQTLSEYDEDELNILTMAELSQEVKKESTAAESRTSQSKT